MISKQVKQEVLREIEPSKKQNQQLHQIVEECIEQLNLQAKDNALDVDFFIGGSFGKGTYLKDDFDVDIFCRCSREYKDENLSNYVEQILEKLNINYQREKGSRDYFSFTYGEESIIKVELVPTRRINSLEDAYNSTDYSYLHVEFVKNHIEKNPELKEEIRLAKTLFKAQGFYGAESYIGGFSGHVVDLLIIHYGSLENLLKDSKEWGKQTIIDVANHYSRKEDILSAIDTTKHSSLLLVDSILPQRNAAKALTKEKYGKYLVWVISKQYLQKQDFHIYHITTKEFIEEYRDFARSSQIILLTYILDLGNIESRDIAGAKIKKLHEKIGKYFSSLGFDLFDFNFHINSDFSKAAFVYCISNESIPSKKWLRGPPFWMSEAVNAVIDKYDEWTIKDNYLWYLAQREITQLSSVEDISLEDCREMVHSSIEFITTIEKKKFN